jgi:hypothetical protein
MSDRLPCPRCGQDYPERVELIHLKRAAILCPECDALWLNDNDVAPPVIGSLGVTWFDFATYMEEHGRPVAHRRIEVRVLGPFNHDSEGTRGGHRAPGS